MLKKTLSLAGALSLFLAVACTNSKNSGTSDSTANADQAMGDSSGKAQAHADISATKADTSGSGMAHFTALDDGKVEMKLTLEFPAKANQSVAVHFHEHGDCSDSGNGAHGHWNPTGEKHGKWDSGEHHSGDIGNIDLDGSGKGEITIQSDRWSIGGDEKTNILDKAIIVHSGVDDYTSQPTGNSGSRIGCGVIMKLK